MKIGVKIFTEQDIAEYFKDKVDFLEVMAVEGENYDFLKDYPLPIVIHAQHERLGLNTADKALLIKNKSSIEFAIAVANKLNSKKIILHPGGLFGENPSEEFAIEFIKKLDKRVILENLNKQKPFFCAMPEETAKFLDKTNRKFCFDINHAIQTSLPMKIDYMPLLKKFIAMKPVHYHFGGQKINGINKAHLCLRESELPLKQILRLLPKDAEITLETENDFEKLKDDVRIMKDAIREIN